MPVTLDCERVWKVACDAQPCGWRTYVSAPDEDAAYARANQRFRFVQMHDGTFRCAQHREAA